MKTERKDNATKIIGLNGRRWIIEDCFRITITETPLHPSGTQRSQALQSGLSEYMSALE